MLLDKLSRFPDLHWFGSMISSRFLEFMREQHLDHPESS
jgi:hypothetical protein